MPKSLCLPEKIQGNLNPWVQIQKGHLLEGENPFVFAKSVSDDTIPEIHTVIASKVG